MSNSMEIALDEKIYDLEAILNTCYSFINRAYIFLDSDKKNKRIVVTIKGKKKLVNKQKRQLEGGFMNELLYNTLRYKISKNNKKIREYIVGRALCYNLLSDFDTAKIQGKTEEPDYKDDPLGIAIPWEEKYGKKNKKNASTKV